LRKIFLPIRPLQDPGYTAQQFVGIFDAEGADSSSHPSANRYCQAAMVAVVVNAALVFYKMSVIIRNFLILNYIVNRYGGFYRF